MCYLGALMCCHVLFLFFLCHISFSMPGNITDQHALLSFKAAITSDPLQITASWNESNYFCEWPGITCGRRNQRVIEVNLMSSKLQGSLSPMIGNLSFLRVIRLSNNSFTGHIPDEIGRLSRLQELTVDMNSFSGEIPKNLSRCLSLRNASFRGNQLTGRLPVELQSLSKLQFIRFRQNNLTGEIPPQYGNLSSLIAFRVSENKLHGSIPDSIVKLRNMRFLILYDNTLSGTIPTSISNLSLVGFDVRFNQFEGYLPLNMTPSLPTLEFFGAFQNHFVGHIPPWLSHASRVQVAELGQNDFIGQVPNLGGLKDLQVLTLGGNRLLGGDIRDLLGPLTNCSDSLQNLGLWETSFRGEIPSYIGNFSHLSSLGMWDSLLTGEIPDEIGQLVSLQILDLSGNRLSGTIPNTIGNIRNLFRLFLGKNKLSGEIPKSLGNVTVLSTLSLGSNNLRGTIPSALSACRFLNILILFENNLSGCIPEGFFPSVSGLVYIDISHNKLRCHLPSEISVLKSLTYLNLSANHLFGEIPQGFGSLDGIETLDVSCNNLTGKIPMFLEGMRSLTYLNLSHNNFEGEVPFRGNSSNEKEIYLEGNNGLCGGVVELHLPKCAIKNTSIKSQRSLLWKLGVPIVCGVLALTAVALLVWRRRKQNASTENGTTTKVIPRVSYRTLHEATNGFSQENLIGSGKFSLVYKGNLDEESNVVAIKVLKLQVKGASKSFIAECDALRHIRHRNLVKVVSTCSSIDNQGNDFKAIIYEYMEEGNLDTQLHREPTRLGVNERVNIAIDIACALSYLHDECGNPLVHCDLKPSNVLLDYDLVAHVSDFGLARFIPEIAHTSSVGIKGTFGYVAPEYGMGSEFSTAGDMYSYGIILLEMFTGKSPTNDIFTDDLNLHVYVKHYIPHRVAEIVDPTLLYDVGDSSGGSSDISSQTRKDRILELLLSIFEIGIACSEDSPRERMDACTAFNKLRSIKARNLTN